jgi:hypothetical protein
LELGIKDLRIVDFYRIKIGNWCLMKIITW